VMSRAVEWRDWRVTSKWKTRRRRRLICHPTFTPHHQVPLSLVSALPSGSRGGKRATLDWERARDGSAGPSHGVSIRSRISRNITTSIIPHHNNEGPIDSAPAHFLASMAIRGSSRHHARMHGPAATAARRLLFHTRQPGSRQEE
jgi:hypothetical protein